MVSGQPEPDQVPAARLVTRQALWGEAAAEIPETNRSLAPLGRLDQDSRGLLLLSEDGPGRELPGDDRFLDHERDVVGFGAVEAHSPKLYAQPAFTW